LKVVIHLTAFINQAMQATRYPRHLIATLMRSNTNLEILSNEASNIYSGNTKVKT